MPSSGERFLPFSSSASRAWNSRRKREIFTHTDKQKNATLNLLDLFEELVPGTGDAGSTCANMLSNS
jgi:hypothetical protein